MGSRGSRVTASQVYSACTLAVNTTDLSDLSLVYSTVWSVMQEKAYQHRIKDVGKSREYIVFVWDELDQRVIDTAIEQWRTRLHIVASRRKAATLNAACPGEL